MNSNQVNNQSSTAKWGWGILLVISALLVINGISWFFLGPSGMTTQIVATWYMGFGLQAFLVALEGYRRATKWAWFVSWVLVGVLVWIGLFEVRSPFGIALLILAAIALAGQLLVRKGMAG